ncbi:shikimate kinase [Tessaracoccus sp. MC1865]|uniref:shikimate kinase n=1 Tax=unclassified Tessaracoccus TaxID=2635419 RepID=UPI0015FF2ADB|nr:MULTISPECIES: shikimate kinase [unclassified Tessaracoccus]MBB1484711.1 shikimate kinase [Tessaracoccus sp. MC1865]MBB1510033.1 shikimate kinase [Tessaracoccus sp. MC1756]QTO36345.1 shikimate kinase [Tessaracoccus sp. MC1865]
MSIVLVGAPGAGKSTVGKRLARKLGKTFVDVDQRIEEVEGKPVAEIFADEGEAYFRALEQEATLELLEAYEVVSLGGGSVMNEAIQQALRDGGHEVIWLKVSIGQATRRVGMNKARPMLLGNVRGRLIELLRERNPVYEALATQIVETDGHGSSEVADDLAAERGAQGGAEE